MNSDFEKIIVFPSGFAGGGGITSTVGNTVIAEISKIGAGVDVASVADIAAPSSWTELVSISGKRKLIWTEIANDYGNFIDIQISSTEDAGEAIRVQVIVDGTTAWDQTITKAAGDIRQVLSYHDITTAVGIFADVYIEETFVIRAARKGTLASVNSWIKTGEIRYLTLE